MRTKQAVLIGLTIAALSVVHAQDRGDATAQAGVRALRPSVPGVQGLVTSVHPLASMAGTRILLGGANAFDAAVAVAAVLNIVEPQSSSIAGNGFATLFEKKTGKVHSLAMAGAAPKALEVSAMTPDTLDAGMKAAIVPGNIGGMGTGVVVGRTGLLFNNGLRLGSTAPYPDNVNYVRAGQIPLLNNSPVIVLKHGQLVLAIGTPGGETIGQTQFQGIINVLDFGLSIQEAIEAPRFRLDPDPNFYKPGANITLAIERRVPAATITAIEAMGHKGRAAAGVHGGCGCMQGILVNQHTKTMTAGADPRRGGYAIGW